MPVLETISTMLLSVGVNPIEFGAGNITAIIIAILFLGISGFVSGSEIAYFSLTPAQCEKLEESERGRSIIGMLSRPERLLATILIANNLVNVTIVVLLNFALGPVFSGMSAVLSFILQSVILTFLILLFGEILPKLYANHKPVGWARMAYPGLRFIVATCRPLSGMLVRSTTIVNRIVSKEDPNISTDDLSQALEITEALVRSGALDVVVVDSVAALVPRAEIEGEMGDSFVGIHARLMSQALRKLAGAINKTNCVVVFINQLREKVGVMYGNPEVTTGGRALKFYASVRIDVRRVETLKSSGELIGNRTRAKVVKNKMAPPFREAEFDIMYGEGISRLGELLDLAVKLDLVQKSGSWFSMGETRLGQGRDAAKQYLKDNPETADSLEAAIRRDFFKLMSSQSQVAAKAAGRAIDVSAEDFDDEP